MTRLLLGLVALAAAALAIVWLSARDLAEIVETETYTECDGETWTWAPINSHSTWKYTAPPSWITTTSPRWDNTLRPPMQRPTVTVKN